jgi:hypothetical protein
LISPAPASTAAPSSKPTVSEELELAARLQELRQELLAIALVDPASAGPLARTAAEVAAGTRRVEAVVDAPSLSAEEARQHFEAFRASVTALHARVAASSPGAAARVERGGLSPALEAALSASASIARSLRLQWSTVDGVLRSGWVQGAGAPGQSASSTLPPALAERVRSIRSEADAIVNRIVTSHQGLVFNVAQRFRGLGLSRADLMQDGNIGLLRAIEKFDAGAWASRSPATPCGGCGTP